MEMFLQASKLKLRFESGKGNLTTEDLWDLPLTQLDVIAKAVNKKVKESEEESFIEVKTSDKKEHSLKLDILKEVIRIKMEENKSKRDKLQRMEELAILKEALVGKKSEEIKNLSSEEIAKRIAELSA